MILKFVYRNEIHRCSKVPSDFQGLLAALKLTFKETLPQAFVLQYEDEDGDKIMLTNDDDYHGMLETNMGGSQTSMKVYITSTNKEPEAQNAVVASDVTNAEAVAQNTSIPSKEEAIQEAESPEIEESKIEEPKPEHQVTEESKPDVLPVEDAPEKFESSINVPSIDEPQINIPPVNQNEPFLTDVSDPNNFLAEVSSAMAVKPEEIQKDEVSVEIASKEDPLMKVIHESEEALSNFDVDPCLAAKVKALTLKTLKDHLDLLAGAVRTNILTLQADKSTSPATIIESLAYIQKLTHGIEGATKDQIQDLNASLNEAIKQCGAIESSIAEEQETRRRIELEESENRRELEKLEELEKLKELEKFEESKKVESQVRDPVAQISCEFVRELNQLPPEISERDLTIYKTIIVKNTGRTAFPPKTYLECIMPQENAKISLPQIKPGEDHTTVLVITSAKRSGYHKTTWRVVGEFLQNQERVVGQPFDITYEIKASQKNKKLQFLEAPIEQEKVYSSSTKQKAREIKEIFPQYAIEDICDYIDNNADRSLDELINDYMSIHSSINS